MKIRQVSYAALASLGNYENQRVELVAEIEEGDEWQDVLKDLETKVHSHLNNYEKYDKYRQCFRQSKRDLEDILRELDKARQNWETVTNFMKAQGLKDNAEEFPALLQLAPAKKSDEAIDGILEM